MSQKTYLYILKIGSFLALLPLFFVFKNLLFPFITSKQIPFNILIEVLLIFWLSFILKYPGYNPFRNPLQKNLVSFGLLAFFAIMVLSCITGVDFNLSFWGDIERMLGAFHILHFFGFYLILITVFRDWNDWKAILIWSLVLSVFLSLKGLSGPEYSTLGNSSYVSGFLIFNIYFAFILFVKEKNSALRWLYLLPLLFVLPAFSKANISGGFVGLGLSVPVVLFLYAILQKNKKIKIASSVVLVLLIALITGLFAYRSSAFVQGNSFLQRTVGDINFKKNTFQTRLISWRAAAKDFKEHPFLGVGHGNYAIVFDKYFDPVFLNYTDQETYFDRAHNNIIDIASTTGVIGLLAYLSIFVFVLCYLIRTYRSGKIGLTEFSLLAGLFSAYFIQNLAVFDSLATYIMLMTTLAYVHWLNRDDGILDVKNPELNITESGREAYALVIAGAVLMSVAFQYNIRPWQMLVATIDGQRQWSQGDFLGTYEAYRGALKNDTVLDRDSRTSFVRIIISSPNVLGKLEKSKAEEVINFAVKHAELNVEYNKGDSLNQMVLAQLYNTAASFYSGTPDKYSFYSNRALDAINLSISASPGRVPTYYQKAQIQITQGDNEGALETLKFADSLNLKYYESTCYIAKTLIFYKRESEAEAYLDRCIDGGGAQKLSPPALISEIIKKYSKKEDWIRVVKLSAALAGLEPNKADNWIKLASAYKKINDFENAKIAAEKAAEVDPKIKADAERFINGLGL